MKVRALVGKKIGMTQLFDESGKVIPVSIIQAGPCRVLEKKSAVGKDRYSAIKLGFEEVAARKLRKPEAGYFAKLGIEPLRYIREVRVPEEQIPEIEVGAVVGVGIFEPGDYVNVTGNIKGRGFSGVMKRWRFRGKRASHGTHTYFRHGGSVGSHTWPGRIWKGKKMPGHYGGTRKTIENLLVVKVVPERNLLLVKGAIPGHKNSLVLVKSALKKWKRG